MSDINVMSESDMVARMNDSHVTQARAELASALNDATLVDDLPYEEANSYAGRRAKWRARCAFEAAQVHATLALVEAYTAAVVPRPRPDAQVQRVVVVAPSRQRAHHWCLDHRVPPHGRRTFVCTTPDSLRGLSLTRQDRVVVVGDPSLDLRQALQMTCPGMDLSALDIEYAG